MSYRDVPNMSVTVGNTRYTLTLSREFAQVVRSNKDGVKEFHIPMALLDGYAEEKIHERIQLFADRLKYGKL